MFIRKMIAIKSLVLKVVEVNGNNIYINIALIKQNTILLP